MPKVASGGFAATFDLQAGSQRWAVRCFHKNVPQDRRLLDRYRYIGDFIRANRDLDFLVPVQYRDDGIAVGGEVYPTVRMRWVDGVSLGVWLARWANEPVPDRRSIDRVRAAIGTAVEALQRKGVAHGDLQHGNILVRPDLTIWLIDYDGMYLPELADLGPIEEGHRNYQHPDRGSNFDETLDYFSAETIDLSLTALAREPWLWEEFGGTGENLLFKVTDFADPEKSYAFEELRAIDGLADRVGRLRDACRSGFADIAAALRGTPATTMYGPRHVVTGPVVSGENSDELRALAGSVVTVFGTVVTTTLQGNDTIALINFGDWRQGDFTIIGYDEVAEALFKKYGRSGSNGKWLPLLKGKRVAIEGLITLYQNKRVEPVTPQIVLEHAQFLQVLDDAQFEEYVRAAQSVGDDGRRVKERRQTTDFGFGRDIDATAMSSVREPVGPAAQPLREIDREISRNARLDKRYRKWQGPAAPSSGGSVPPAENRPPPVPAQYRREPVAPPPHRTSTAPPVEKARTEHPGTVGPGQFPTPPQPYQQQPAPTPYSVQYPVYRPPAQPLYTPPASRRSGRRTALVLTMLFAGVVVLAFVVLLL